MYTEKYLFSLLYPTGRLCVDYTKNIVATGLIYGNNTKCVHGMRVSVSNVQVKVTQITAKPNRLRSFLTSFHCVISRRRYTMNPSNIK